MKSIAGQRGTLLLAFAVSGGAWAWTLQLWLSWTLGEPLCFLHPAGFALAGLDGRVLWILIGLGTGALALAALLASLWIWRKARVRRSQGTRAGPRQFLGFVGLVLNSVLLLAIVMGATSPIFLEACV